MDARSRIINRQLLLIRTIIDVLTFAINNKYILKRYSSTMEWRHFELSRPRNNLFIETYHFALFTCPNRVACEIEHREHRAGYFVEQFRYLKVIFIVILDDILGPNTGNVFTSRFREAV